MEVSTHKPDLASGAAVPDASVIEALASAGVEVEGATAAVAPQSAHVIVRAIEMISIAAGALAGLLLVAAMLVICQMIFVRAVLGWSTIWQTEFVVYAATAAIFIGAPRVLSQRGHVGVDFVQMMLRGTMRRVVERLAQVLGLGFCVAMTYASWRYFYEAYDNGWRTETVWAIPLWIPIAPLVLGFGLLCLQYIAEMIKYQGGQR